MIAKTLVPKHSMSEANNQWLNVLERVCPGMQKAPDKLFDVGIKFPMDDPFVTYQHTHAMRMRQMLDNPLTYLRGYAGIPEKLRDVAVMLTLDPWHQLATLNIPCGVCVIFSNIRFRITRGKLECCAVLPSIEAWNGLPRRMAELAALSTFVLLALRKLGHSVELGEVYLTMDSVYVSPGHMPLAQRATWYGSVSATYPRMFPASPLTMQHLMDITKNDSHNELKYAVEFYKDIL